MLIFLVFFGILLSRYVASRCIPLHPSTRRHPSKPKEEPSQTLPRFESRPNVVFPASFGGSCPDRTDRHRRRAPPPWTRPPSPTPRARAARSSPGRAPPGLPRVLPVPPRLPVPPPPDQQRLLPSNLTSLFGCADNRLCKANRASCQACSPRHGAVFQQEARSAICQGCKIVYEHAF